MRKFTHGIKITSASKNEPARQHADLITEQFVAKKSGREKLLEIFEKLKTYLVELKNLSFNHSMAQNTLRFGFIFVLFMIGISFIFYVSIILPRASAFVSILLVMIIFIFPLVILFLVAKLLEFMEKKTPKNDTLYGIPIDKTKLKSVTLLEKALDRANKDSSFNLTEIYKDSLRLSKLEEKILEMLRENPLVLESNEFKDLSEEIQEKIKIMESALEKNQKF